MVKRSQKVADRLGVPRAVDCVGSGAHSAVASEGARSIGQEAVTSGRDSFEQAADAIRSLAEAKSPTEYLQLQSEFARASFDRAVAESSRLTESLVKLAGEAIPAAVEPRVGQRRAFQHPRCLTLSPPLVRATTVGGRSQSGRPPFYRS
jgi:phasin family protein